MNKNYLVAGAALALAFAIATPAKAQKLFTTQEDFATGWSVGAPGITLGTGTAGDTDHSTVNGIGNGTSPGGAGTAGAMNNTWTTAAPGYDSVYTLGEAGNAAFINALKNGTTLTLDYTLPTSVTSATFFNIDLIINNNLQFTSIASSSHFSTAAGTYTLTYGITGKLMPAASYNYLSLGFGVNTNSTQNFNFQMDNIQIQSVPEPASLTLIGLAGLALLRRRRGA